MVAGEVEAAKFTRLSLHLPPKGSPISPTNGADLRHADEKVDPSDHVRLSVVVLGRISISATTVPTGS